MKYNCSIQNESAIPLPYSLLRGANDVSVGSLRKDQPMFVWLDYITGSYDGRCFRFNCKVNDKITILVMPVDPDINIKFVPESETK